MSFVSDTTWVWFRIDQNIEIMIETQQLKWDLKHKQQQKMFLETPVFQIYI